MKAHNLKKMFAYAAVILLLSVIYTSIVDASSEEDDEEIINKYTFTEKEFEPEANSYYFGARHYNPNLAGRFTSPDPAGGFNRYEYCGNNPLRFVDPSGCQYVDVCPADALWVEQGISIDSTATLSTEAGYSTFVGFDFDNGVAKSSWDDVVAATKHIFSKELTEEEIENELSKPNAIMFDMGIVGDRLHHANYVLTDFLWPWKIDEDFWDLTVAILGFGLCVYACGKGEGGKTIKGYTAIDESGFQVIRETGRVGGHYQVFPIGAKTSWGKIMTAKICKKLAYKLGRQRQLYGHKAYGMKFYTLGPRKTPNPVILRLKFSPEQTIDKGWETCVCVDGIDFNMLSIKARTGINIWRAKHGLKPLIY